VGGLTYLVLAAATVRREADLQDALLDTATSTGT